jgi:hypothetical protein
MYSPDPRLNPNEKTVGAHVLDEQSKYTLMVWPYPDKQKCVQVLRYLPGMVSVLPRPAPPPNTSMEIESVRASRYTVISPTVGKSIEPTG